MDPRPWPSRHVESAPCLGEQGGPVPVRRWRQVPQEILGIPGRAGAQAPSQLARDCGLTGWTTAGDGGKALETRCSGAPHPSDQSGCGCLKSTDPGVCRPSGGSSSPGRGACPNPPTTPVSLPQAGLSTSPEQWASGATEAAARASRSWTVRRQPGRAASFPRMRRERARVLSEAPTPGMRQASDQELTSPCTGLGSPPNVGRQLATRLRDPFKNPKRMRLALR